MAIVVDKVQKRKDIALACKELFFQNGINDLTISKVASAAGVGKGTIYEYFKNKEEIVFEIVNILIHEHNIGKKARIDALDSSKEKMKEFFSIFYRDEDIELRQLYREFISISLVNLDHQMLEFNTNCSNTYLKWFQEILQEGINKGEFAPNVMKLAKGLFVMGEGFFISHSITNSQKDIQQELYTFYDTLFEFIEVKK
jgi:AcrR family transcriptional regulator